MTFLTFVLWAAWAGAQEPTAIWSTAGSPSAVLPTYLSLAANINDFTRFGDGGPDSNWYIGFNNAWIARLPAAPEGQYARAFLGAKVGRAKTRPQQGKPWLREPINGEVYVALSPTPAFTSEQSHFLAESADIPVEADAQHYVEGAGAAQWFWVEIPVASVSTSGPNYAAIWSPTRAFTSAATSPILSGQPLDAQNGGPAEPQAWNNHSISGVPPRTSAGALETPLANIAPALAIKLVPQEINEINVRDLSVRQAGRKWVVEFSAGGENVSEAWVETSKDQLDWRRVTRILRQAPYIFTLQANRFPAPGEFLRAAARDISGNIGTSEPYGVKLPLP